MKKYLMIVCEILRDEVDVCLKDNPQDYPIIYLPPDLHRFPDNLREYLQDLINRTENVDYIVLPMGRCGNGTVGLTSPNATLVLPKCEDCVNLLLSREYLQVERPKYSMFFTNGWLKNDKSPDSEYRRTVEKYGEEEANMVMNMMYAGYKYFTLIDTGAYDKAAATEKLRHLASVVDVEINQVEGKFGVLRKMLRLEFDENFAMVPPNTPVTPEMLE